MLDYVGGLGLGHRPIVDVVAGEERSAKLYRGSRPAACKKTQQRQQPGFTSCRYIQDARHVFFACNANTCTCAARKTRSPVFFSPKCLSRCAFIRNHKREEEAVNFHNCGACVR